MPDTRSDPYQVESALVPRLFQLRRVDKNRQAAQSRRKRVSKHLQLFLEGKNSFGVSDLAVDVLIQPLLMIKRLVPKKL